MTGLQTSLAEAWREIFAYLPTKQQGALRAVSRGMVECFDNAVESELVAAAASDDDNAWAMRHDQNLGLPISTGHAWRYFPVSGKMALHASTEVLVLNLDLIEASSVLRRCWTVSPRDGLFANPYRDLARGRAFCVRQFDEATLPTGFLASVRCRRLHFQSASKFELLPPSFCASARRLVEVDLSAFTNVRRIAPYFLCGCHVLESVDLSAMERLEVFSDWFLCRCPKLREFIFHECHTWVRYYLTTTFRSFRGSPPITSLKIGPSAVLPHFGPFAFDCVIPGCKVGSIAAVVQQRRAHVNDEYLRNAYLEDYYLSDAALNDMLLKDPFFWQRPVPDSPTTNPSDPSWTPSGATGSGLDGARLAHEYPFPWPPLTRVAGRFLINPLQRSGTLNEGINATPQQLSLQIEPFRA